ncbi:MAG TPA: sensor domain-containing protein, partial [Jatrophihabitantaceae bacterium]|nr:sensor domain-containing protein [Jatrophihabitantaceae bacterium]
LIVLWVGLPLLCAAILGTRQLARVHRKLASGLLGIDMPSPYLRVNTGNLLTRMRRLLTDPATRRDALWLIIDGTLGLALAIVAVLEALIDLLFWWLPPALALRATAHLDAALLRTSEKSLLALRVQELTESRTQTVDSAAAELRRIERDLHDGTQARLVLLGMSLGLAEEQLERNPELARQLLAEARAASTEALGELRDLVRGIHPPVLADRGLGGAVQALALAAPFPVSVDLQLAERLPAPAEAAAYFAVAEALTNVIKHSRATSAVIVLRHDGSTLSMSVTDDGIGGALIGGGSGLTGIARRLSAFDGRLAVSSPTGGPTVVTMELPCASSSPRTLPSSGTA